MKKPDLDREVAFETGDTYQNTSIATELFLRKLMEAVARGEEVHLKGFGKFRLARQGGAPPPNPRFGGGYNDPTERRVRFRVHFSKSVTFTREVKKHNQEKSHGKVRRR